MFAMEKAQSLLQQVYGYDQFRSGQQQIVEHIAAGYDTVGIMPTGGGKSLCYQIPALLLPGVTLVISPLISLMKDQVDALHSLGIAAAFINSTLEIGEAARLLRKVQAGQIKLLYIAPERLETEWFRERARTLTISMVAVDEAHCVSQWGHDFRPSYRNIAPFIQDLIEHNGVQPLRAAFTATATPEVKTDLIELLQLYSPKIVITGFKRENLAFTVLRGEDRKTFTLHYVQQRAQQAGIIYASTRKEVEHVYGVLQRAGIAVGKYHAGLTDEERTNMQAAFLYDDIRVMVATNAFGMGIDKSNVRYVLHYDMPKHIEAYVQEAGRAGRDGERSECVLLFHPQNVVMQKFFIEQSEVSAARKGLEYKKLQAMIDYCYTTECLQNYMIRYFGEEVQQACKFCGNCQDEREAVDITIEAQKIFSCIYRMRERFGVVMVAAVLKGSRNKKVLQYHFEQLPTYGELRHLKEKEIADLIYVLIAEGYLALSEGQYPVVRLLSLAIDVLKGNRVVEQRRAKSLTSKADAAIDKTLFEQLRLLRRELAQNMGVPPYVIFNDSTLLELAERQPTTEGDMLRIKGVGHMKLKQFGQPFLSFFQQQEVEAGLYEHE